MKAARKDHRKKTLPAKKYFYTPLEANEASNVALKAVDASQSRLVIRESDIEEHRVQLADRKRRRMRGRPPTVKPYTDALFGGNVSEVLVEDVMRALVTGMPCLPRMTAVPSDEHLGDEREFREENALEEALNHAILKFGCRKRLGKRKWGQES
jgi:hypothetical protein